MAVAVATATDREEADIFFGQKLAVAVLCLFDQWNKVGALDFLERDNR